MATKKTPSARTIPHVATEICAAINGVSVAELVAQHGSPLYVFSEAALRHAYRLAHSAFCSRYPDVQFAWSYKTNYLRAICAVFHQEGAIAEVVSDFEYEKARAGGVPGPEIIFNGPYKSKPALERALYEGAKIQIDNFDELATVSDLAGSLGRPADVALRVYLDSGVRPVWTKFGFNADTNEAAQAIERLGRCRWLRLAGLHTHIGTLVLDPEAYARASAKLVELAQTARREQGFEVGYLNLGGGFPSPCRLQQRDLAAPSPALTIDAYAQAICQTIAERWPKEAKLPRLYLEAGRALVDDSGYLITTIVAAKRAEAATGYVVDAGINLLSTSLGAPLGVKPSRNAPGPLSDRTLYGCLCMNTDVLRESVPLPELAIGDLLVFHPVGAYNVTQSMQFIAYRPRVVLVTEKGNVEVIRERETLQHVEALERLPENLQAGFSNAECNGIGHR